MPPPKRRRAWGGGGPASAGAPLRRFDVLLEAISAEEFEISASEGILSLLAGGREKLGWDAYEELLEKCARRRFAVDRVPEPVLDLLFREEPGPAGFDPRTVPFWERLKPHQREGVAEFYRRNFRIMVADPPGLGKSAQALAMVFSLAPRRVLVLSPKSICPNWALRELPKWTGRTGRVVRTERDADEAEAEEERIWVMTYESLAVPSRKLFERVTQANWDAVVCDECHKLKNHEAAVTQNLGLLRGALLQKTRAVVMLSGTPLTTSKPVQLFSLTQILRKNELSHGEFALRYCAGAPGFRGKLDDSGISNIFELELYFSRMMIRRRAEDVLPPKRRSVVWVDFDEEARREYQKAEAEYREAVRDYLAKKPSEGQAPGWRAAQAQMKVRQLKSGLLRLCGNLKKEKAWEVLERELLPREKSLWFAHHATVRDFLVEKLAQAEIPAVHICGETTQENRHAFIRRVADPGDQTRVGVMSVTAASEGIDATPGVTLTAFVEIPWTAAACDQAEARAYRIGCEKPQRVLYVAARGTIEEKLLAKHREQNELTSFCLNGRTVVEREFFPDSDESDSESDDSERESGP